MPTANTPFAYGTREYYQYIGRKGGLETAKRRVENSVEGALRRVIGWIIEAAQNYIYAEPSLPNDIADAMSVGELIKYKSGFSIDILVDLGTDSIDDRRGRRAARAFEYGSGIHGDKGETYVIEPKRSNVLAFVWPGHAQTQPLGAGKVAGYFEGPDKSGREGPGFYFHWVDHPGVRQNSYLRDSINLYRNELTRETARAFKDGWVTASEKFVIGK